MAEAIVLGLGGFASAGAATAALGTVGYNLAIAGVSLGLSVATSAIVSALTPLPPSPKQSILVNARDAAAPQEFVYGETRKGGVTTYYESTRKGSVLYQIIAVAAHEVESIDAIYVNDKQVTLSTDGYDNGSRSGAGWVTDDEWTDDDTEHEIRIFYHLGDQTTKFSTFANSGVESLDTVFFNTGSADEDSQNFGGVGQPTRESFIGNGIAYIFVRYGFNAGVFSKGLPLITCKLKGKKVYDPRTTNTVYSNNAALCIRDYLTSAYGLNDPNVDDTVFSAAANTCDENVTLDAGGTEKRYTLNGVVTAGQSYGDVLQQMITSCGGTLFWGGGKWKLGVGEYNAPTKVLTLDDLRSNISLQTRTNLRDQFNRVQGVFADASNRYLVADYPPIESAPFLAQDDGVEQTLDLDLPFTTSSATAQRLAKQVLFRGREQMVFSADFGLNAFDVEVGEIVALTVERYGWTEKEFEVVGWNFNSSSEGGDLRVSLTLRETSAAAFSWTAEESEIINNDSDLVTTLEPVGNLTATFDGTVSTDGTFLNGILVDWDSVVGSSGYEVEWTVNNSIDYAANGGIVEEADAVTTRELFIYKGYIEILYRQPDQDGFDFYNTGGGSGLTEAAFRAQIAASPERASLKFSGLVVQNPTTEYTIKPALDDTIYNIRVRAINNNGVKSLWRAVTFTTVPDNTIPNAPSGVTATGGTRAIKLSWNKVTTNTDASVANDIFLYAVYRGTSTNPTTLVDTTAGEGWSDVGLLANTTYYYRVKAIDFSGNESAFSLNASAATDAAATAGADGDRTYTGTVYYSVVTDATITLPDEAGVTFNESTGTFTGGTFSATPGWRHTQPQVDITDTSLLEWECQYRVTVSGDLSFPQTSVPNTEFSFSNLTSAIQVTTNIESDNFNGSINSDGTFASVGTQGWAITRNGGNAVFSNATIRGLIDGGELNIISGSRSAIIDPEGSFEVLDIAGTGRQTVGRFVQTSGSSTGDVLEIRKEGASGRALFVDCRSTTTDGVFINMDNFSNTGDGLHIQQDGSGNGLYVDHNNTSGQAIEVSASNDGILVNALDKGIVVNTSGTTFGDNAGDFENTGTSGGHVKLGLPSGDQGWGVYVPTTSLQGVFAEVNGTSRSRDAGWFRNSGTGGGWIILGRSTGNAGWAFDAPAGNGRLQAGTYTPFTGSHDGLLLKGSVLEVGDILCDSQVVFSSISDGITIVAASNQTNQKSCIGVYKSTFSVWDLPLLGDNHQLEDNYDHIHINSVGEGAINVCGENGNISKGDLIVTSSMPGKGMKQADDIVRSYTVAKAREDVTFGSPTEVKMVACIYLCG